MERDISSLNQPTLARIRRRLGPIGGTRLVEDVAYVSIHRVESDEQFLTYLSRLLLPKATRRITSTSRVVRPSGYMGA